MKQESLAAFLVGTFSVCALAAMVLSAKYCFSARTLHRIQSRVMAVQSRVNVTQALLNETIDYSKRNPAVEQLLRRAGVWRESAADQGDAQQVPLL